MIIIMDAKAKFEGIWQFLGGDSRSEDRRERGRVMKWSFPWPWIPTAPDYHSETETRSPTASTMTPRCPWAEIIAAQMSEYMIIPGFCSSQTAHAQAALE